MIMRRMMITKFMLGSKSQHYPPLKITPNPCLALFSDVNFHTYIYISYKLIIKSRDNNTNTTHLQNDELKLKLNYQELLTTIP